MRRLRFCLFGILIGTALVVAPGAGGTGARSLDDWHDLFGTVRSEFTQSFLSSNGVSTDVVADLSVARNTRGQPGPALGVLTGTWRETQRWSDSSEGCSQVFTTTSSGGTASWIYSDVDNRDFRFRPPAVSLPVTEQYESQGPCQRRVGAGRGSPINLRLPGSSTPIPPGHPSRLTGTTEGSEVSGFGVKTTWRMTWDLVRRREAPPPRLYVGGKFVTTIRGGAKKLRGRWTLLLRPLREVAQNYIASRNGRRFSAGGYDTPVRGKITFTDTSNTCKVRRAGGIPGEYNYSLKGRTLRLRPVKELCAQRRAVLSGRRFTRVR